MVIIVSKADRLSREKLITKSQSSEIKIYTFTSLALIVNIERRVVSWSIFLQMNQVSVLELVPYFLKLHVGNEVTR